MKGVTRVNVVFLAFNVVVAAVLGVALLRFVASDNPAAVRAPGGTNSAPNATPHAGTVRKPGVEYGFTPQGGGNAATPAGATTGTAPPSSSNDGGSGRDWSLRSLAASPPGASGRTSEIVPAVPASQRAVPPGTAPSIPSKSDVRAGTVVNGSGVPAVPGAPAGAQPPASHTGPTDPTPPPPVDPTSDRTPPVLDALSFNPPQIADGAATTLLVTVHDDLSGVKRVTGNLRSPSGTAIVSFEGQGDNAGTVFGTSIAIPKQAETGNWFVTNLFITDRADNTMVATYTAATTPAGGTLRVMSSQSDSVCHCRAGQYPQLSCGAW